ncbi:hypothetical protein [Bdellovibrio sp. HCB-162]|uniref:hypothetical protein n=1 Tax=Bdellovibrio sp. HCB-162 TaxID=3394234 RepID=UPI0039BD64D6
MRKILFVIFLLLSTNALAARSNTEWSLHLDTKLDVTYFPEVYGEDTNQEFYKLELDPIYNWKYKDFFRFYLKPTFIADPNNKSDEEKYFFDLSEAYIRYQTESFSIKAGNNIFTWGVTDGYNPLDVINSRQYFDPLHSRKLGATSLVYAHTFDNWDLEAVYIPKNRGSTMPGPQSRWLPREVFVPETPDNDIVLLLPKTLRYSYTSRQDLDHALDNNAALRIQRRGSFIDLGLTYFEGVASFPLVQPMVTGTIVQVSPKTVVQVDPDVVLNTKNYRIRQGGFTFVSNQWDFLFKYATAYTQSLGDDKNLPGWTHENVLGFEKTFNIGSDAVLIAILQHSFISSERENDSNLSYTEIFRRAWMLGGRMTWKEVWNFSLLGLYDQIHGSNYEEVTLGRRFFDAWLVSLTASLIQGPSDTPLGVYEKNDSYTLSVSRSF